MGSGHFPVEVTEYIARFLVELGVQPEETGEADLTYWKRRVAQQCIYGVDLNPLAVELAKLSLWLITAAIEHNPGVTIEDIKAQEAAYSAKGNR